jgi:leucyl aminopeptidase
MFETTCLLRINRFMNFDLKTLTQTSALSHKTDLMVVAIKTGENKLPASKSGSNHPVLSQYLREIQQEESFDAKTGKTLLILKPLHVQAKRILLLGVGDATEAQIRKAVNSCFSSVKSLGYKEVTLYFDDSFQGFEQSLKHSILAISDAVYLYTKTKPSAKLDHASLSRASETSTKGDKKGEYGAPSGINLVTIAHSGAKSASFKQAFAEATALGEGIELAKEWGNRPANYATPTHLGQVAQNLGKQANIKVNVMGPKEVEKLGMGSFISVAKGSSEPLRFITMEYRGAKAKSLDPVVLVGKGITFDTGGISLKPGAGMDEMKFDMCGAASVLGVFKTLSLLNPADLHVVGLIPTCENMPDGLAVKPGDVVTSMSGQTIEILNTDAEGRLILCDALTYAKRFKPKAVIDIATLTGACVIALGHVRSGLFSNNDALASAIQEAGETSLDTCWRMPLDDEYADALKSNFADVANVGDRSAGSVTAAKFLQRFANEFAWAHLDIAGTAWRSGGSKGSTGRPVGLLMEFLLRHSKISSKVEKTK